MQVLAAQYPTLYTRKFRVFYTDFNSGGLNNKVIDLFTIGPAYDIAFIKLNPTIKFVGTGISSANLSIYGSNNIASPPSTVGRYAVTSCSDTVSPSKGFFGLLQQPSSSGGGTLQYAINSVTGNTTMRVACILNAGANINNLTAGQADIWITTCRNP